MILAPHIPSFQWKEVVCPHCQRVKIDDRFWRHMQQLQALRNWWDGPIKVTSGYRCPRHNVNIGGAARSQHMHFATDIQATGTPQQILDAVDPLADRAERLDFDGIGRYPTFVHLDLRGNKAAWNER